MKQLAALPERAFPDGVEDEVVALGVGGEVGGRAVDHPVGSEPGDEVDVLAAAHRRHVRPEALDDLHRRRADGARGAVDEDLAAVADTAARM